MRCVRTFCCFCQSCVSQTLSGEHTQKLRGEQWVGEVRITSNSDTERLKWGYGRREGPKSTPRKEGPIELLTVGQKMLNRLVSIKQKGTIPLIYHVFRLWMPILVSWQKQMKTKEEEMKISHTVVFPFGPNSASTEQKRNLMKNPMISGDFLHYSLLKAK